MSAKLSIIVLGFVTLQRLGELALARRNTRQLLARGAVEAAPGHYPLIVMLHGAWLAGLWYFASDRPVSFFWLSLFVILQGLRVWVIATLGERWTTRIIVLPGADRIRHGPYRLVSHPNYLIVIAEIAILPLVFGLITFAAIFSLLNALVLLIRVRAESHALRWAQERG
ncbi:MAG: isoprenylcysteine carboxylmethyltransferase family protein [Methyloligellaceae bacterium]